MGEKATTAEEEASQRGTTVKGTKSNSDNREAGGEGGADSEPTAVSTLKEVEPGGSDASDPLKGLNVTKGAWCEKHQVREKSGCPG